MTSLVPPTLERASRAPPNSTFKVEAAEYTAAADGTPINSHDVDLRRRILYQ